MNLDQENIQLDGDLETEIAALRRPILTLSIRMGCAGPFFERLGSENQRLISLPLAPIKEVWPNIIYRRNLSAR